LPHTHLDAGWLKTFEQYYKTEVKDILDSLLSTLKKNP
jgi:Glycosyl hydrolases family 38 N-terminal domain